MDATGGKIYWVDVTNDNVRRADLDGSNDEVLVAGQTSPLGIAVDPTGGKIYWTDNGTNNIQSADLNGANVVDLGIAGLVGPIGIAVVLRTSTT